MSRWTEAGMISSNGNIILFILDHSICYTDRFGFEGVILGYGSYDIWTEDMKHGGEILPTENGIKIRSNKKNYYSSKTDVEKMLWGQQKTAPVTKIP